MQSNISVAKRMLAYAEEHKLEWQNPKTKKPICSTVNPVWGGGKRKLAWRVSAHAFGEKHASAKKTQALCDLLFPPTLAVQTVRVAETKVGVHEVGSSNSGKWVDLFLKAVYLPGGYAWCAAFVSWCFVSAMLRLKLVKDYEAGRDLLHDLMYGNAAYVPNWLRAAREGRTVRGWRIVLVPADKARAGDIVIFWGGGHIGLLRKAGWLLRLWRRTVEGNTSDTDTGDQANGGEVVNKRRTKGDITAYARLIPPKS